MRPRRVTAPALSRDVAPTPWRSTLLAAVWGVLATGSSIGLMATSAWLITRSSERPPVFALAVAMGAVQAFALGRGLSRYAQRLSVHAAALHALSRLRVWLYDVIEPLVPNGLPGRGTGSVVNGFVDDVEIVTEAVAKERTAAIDVGASVVIGAAIAAVLLPRAAVLLVVSCAAMVCIAIVLARLGRAGAAASGAARAQLADAAADSLRSARELVVYGRRDLVEHHLADVHRRAARASAGQAVSTGIARGVVIMAAGAGLIAVVLAGIAAHNGGGLTGVTLAVLVFVALAVFEQVGALPATLAGATAGDAAAQRLVDLAGLEPAVSEPAADRGGERQRRDVVPPRSSAPPQDAALYQVRVAAPRDAGALLLDDVSLSVAAGARIALAGRSGSGKTTALHTLLHFLEPSTGSAALGGVDVRTMGRPAIAQRVAWLPETTHVFDATLADNLRLARPSATAEECVSALRRVGLEQWYASLPDALDTRLGPAGRVLSAGEQQRLGLARTLLSDAGTLLLDEPTAHLDPASAIDVLSDVLSAAGPRSALVVSHEPAVAELVDEVVLLSDGRISGAVATGGEDEDPATI